MFGLVFGMDARGASVVSRCMRKEVYSSSIVPGRREEAIKYLGATPTYSLVLNRSRGATIKHNPDFPLISSITSMFFGERMACLVFPPGFQLFLYAS